MEKNEKDLSGTSLTEVAGVSVSASDAATARRTDGEWRICEYGDESNPQCIIGTNGAFIANTLGGNDEANAEFIVRACNSHDELIGVAKWFLADHDAHAAEMMYPNEPSACWCSRCVVVRAIIAKAESK